jgi:hypothetical protein
MKRESVDEHQVTREDMGARWEQRKKHHRESRGKKRRRPGLKTFFLHFF